MNKTILICFLLLAAGYFLFARQVNENDFISFRVNTRQQDLRLYWKDDKGNLFRSLGNLKRWMESKGQKPVFAMNAGMYQTGNVPLGLFIENGRTITPLNTRSATGNFYLKPNGVFYLTKDKKAGICPTERFKNAANIAYATQSGPMLLTGGAIHPAFKKGSVNLNIRNGVGILPNGDVVFAMSKKAVSLYDFAIWFKELGCSDALYLDGFVSRTYLPGKNWVQLDGDFGVIIGVIGK